MITSSSQAAIRLIAVDRFVEFMYIECQLVNSLGDRLKKMKNNSKADSRVLRVLLVAMAVLV